MSIITPRNLLRSCVKVSIINVLENTWGPVPHFSKGVRCFDRGFINMTARVRFCNYASGNQRNSLETELNSNPGAELEDPVTSSKDIFFQGLKRVLPSRLITSQVQLHGALLRLDIGENGTAIDLSQYNKKYVVGFGKACLPMAESLLELLNGLVDRCLISIPAGSRKCRNSSVEVYRGAANNLPDENSFKAAQKIVEVVRSCTPDDLLIVLVSGGGSALLPFPIPPVTLEEKMNLIRSLSKAGCSIDELNTVRKRLSVVKGGGLVEICNAGRIVSLIISDVLGSPLDIIASGPTVPNNDKPNAALSIVKTYNLEDSMSDSIRSILTQPNPRNLTLDKFSKVANFILGDNEMALEAASKTAIQHGLHPFIVTSKMSGDAAELGYDLATLAEAIANGIKQSTRGEEPSTATATLLHIFSNNNWSTDGIIPQIFHKGSTSSNGVCLLFGGETTVKVKGSGLGGRNQEMALSTGIRLDVCRNLCHVKNKIAILCAGTDGIDGPTDAAGAVVDGSTIHQAQLQRISPLKHLEENDSYNFFQKVADGKYHIVCGHTETNVMDIAMIVILTKESSTGRRKLSML